MFDVFRGRTSKRGIGAGGSFGVESLGFGGARDGEFASGRTCGFSGHGASGLRVAGDLRAGAAEGG